MMKKETNIKVDFMTFYKFCVTVVVLSITIISRDSELGLTQKKLEGYKKYAEIIQYGRKNPVKFAETFL